MTLYSNLTVVSTYVSRDAQNAWAYLSGTGIATNWRKIKTGATDGVTNVFVLLCAAQTSGRKVSLDIDASNLITYAYLL
jgi:hypothetical protein